MPDMDMRMKFMQLIEQVFARNQVLSGIYSEKDIKNIGKDATVTKIAKLIDKLPMIHTDNKNHVDLVGDAYEQLLANSLTGKFLGQFLTPSVVRDLLVTKLIKPKANESVLDITCGTGGFLVSAIKYLGDSADFQFAS
jgi:type I restriction enzyme M protein